MQQDRLQSPPNTGAEDESADPVGDGHSDAEFAQQLTHAAEPTVSLSAPSTQDAMALVLDDHQRIRASLKALLNALAVGASNADRQGLLSRLALRLRAHGTVEAELLYPRLYPTHTAAPAEHEQFEQSLQALSAASTSLHQQNQGVVALALRVHTHFEQEERDLLAYVASHPGDWLELGTRMALRRGELLADESSD